MGYQNLSFPQVDTSLLKYYTITYYDDYNYPGVKAFDQSGDISGYPGYGNDTLYFKGTRSLVTGTKTLVLDGDSNYLTATTYYDDRYRPIEVIRDLYDESFGKETVSNKYSFTGLVLQTKISQLFNDSTKSINKYYSYDHMGRLLRSEQEIVGDNNGKVTLSKMEYSEIGQLKQKDLHVGESGALETIDYKYNIRGWLTGVNDPGKLKERLFAMSLYYNDVSGVSQLNTERQFNGNISGIKWKSEGRVASDTIMKAYGFTYDGLNRLKASDYGEGNALTSNADRYNESIGNYDRNGNILSLSRSGFENQVPYSDYDVLCYSYDGNKLIGVEDSGQNAKGFIDSHSYSSGSHDYDYDVNGNMVKDLNKGIATIKYNYLNLPLEVKKDNSNKIVYTYDATGIKLRKSAYIDSIAPLNRYYAGSFEYGNTKTLELIHTDEGVANSTGNTYSYEYFLKDHLGNTRVAFEFGANNTVLLTQSTDYYPFGMSFGGQYNNTTNNKYLFGGKELQDESLGGVNLDWYDYGARFYDPQIGRWHVIDPLAEKAFDWSPYRYGFDNPISTTDPSGMFEDWVDKTGKGQWEWDENVKSEAAAKEKYGDNAKYAALGETYYAKDGRQVVLQDQGNWSYTSQTRGDADCPSCGLNNGNTGWLEQFQAGVQSYQPLLKAAEISLTVSAALLTGEIGAGTSLFSKGAETLSGGRVFWSGGNTAKTAAAEFAKASGMETLEMTTTGSIMNTISPYLPNSITRPIWNKLSTNFARGATGDINVFQNTAGISLKSTWAKIEFPILQNKNIIYQMVK